MKRSTTVPQLVADRAKRALAALRVREGRPRGRREFGEDRKAGCPEAAPVDDPGHQAAAQLAIRARRHQAIEYEPLVPARGCDCAGANVPSTDNSSPFMEQVPDTRARKAFPLAADPYPEMDKCSGPSGRMV